MTVLSLDEVRRRAAVMDAARRMGTQESLPEPTAETRAIEDRVVTGELTVDEAVALIIAKAVNGA